ncbi:MAG: phosphatase PAP2 family protein [Maribacter sp.]|nr:phosphatase PAP2 family protein [Maribacter sp.]NNE02178.1 phosphatase PAP2 family protein [Eudoraea sp.]
MKLFQKIISYLFHPLFIPIAGTFAYFLITPKYSPLAIQSGNIIPIFILTVIIPVIAFFILRNIGYINSIQLPTIQERKYPMYINMLLLLLVVYKVIPNNYIIELYFYFVGLIVASLATLILLLFKIKSSMHLMGMGSLLMFLINLSIHFEINITLALSLFIFAIGLVATSRLYLRVHSKAEVVIGFCIGLIAQLLTVKYWL